MNFFYNLLFFLAIGTIIHAPDDNHDYNERLINNCLEIRYQTNLLREKRDRWQQQRLEGIKEFLLVQQLSKQMTEIKDPVAKKND